jgi:hypothetical protein
LPTVRPLPRRPHALHRCRLGGTDPEQEGKRYQDTAWEDIDECLRVHLKPRLGPKRLVDIRQRDLQQIVDELTPKLSGSRVHSIVNAFVDWCRNLENTRFPYMFLIA